MVGEEGFVDFTVHMPVSGHGRYVHCRVLFCFIFF